MPQGSELIKKRFVLVMKMQSILLSGKERKLAVLELWKLDLN